MLLKSSDFVLHDLSADSVFEGCIDNKDDDNEEEEEEEEARDDGAWGKTKTYEYGLELVLRKWFAIDPSREMRAFVRDGVLVGKFPVSSRPFPMMTICILCIVCLFFFCLTVLLSHAQASPSGT